MSMYQPNFQPLYSILLIYGILSSLPLHKNKYIHILDFTASYFMSLQGDLSILHGIAPFCLAELTASYTWYLQSQHPGYRAVRKTDGSDIFSLFTLSSDQSKRQSVSGNLKTFYSHQAYQFPADGEFRLCVCVFIHVGVSMNVLRK